MTETPRVILITGGARGLGRATAERFAESGDIVCLGDRDAPDPRWLKSQRTAGHTIEPRTLDIVDRAAVESWVEDVVASHGPIDVLVNNAGIVRDAIFVQWKDGDVVSSMSDEAFDSVVDVNLRGVFLCTRAVVPVMARAGRGVVLSATSIVARDGNFGQTNYAATKAGVVAMTQTWARELGRYGIRVNAVAPGFVDTEMLRTIPADRLEAMARRVPLGRLGDPRDVAEAYWWLASDAAKYVHGIVLPVDGGAVHGT